MSQQLPNIRANAVPVDVYNPLQLRSPDVLRQKLDTDAFSVMDRHQLPPASSNYYSSAQKQTNLTTYGAAAMAQSQQSSAFSRYRSETNPSTRQARFGASNQAATANAPDTNNDIIFDYNVFVTSWQDKIRMRHYKQCEEYCRQNIQKLFQAEQEADRIKKQKATGDGNGSAVLEASLTQSGYNYREYRSKVHFSLGYLYKKYMGKFDEARRQYELSITCDEDNPGAHFNFANLLVDHYSDYVKAEEHFEKAIAIEPGYAMYRMTYAEFLWHDCARYEDTAKQYEALLRYHSRKNKDGGGGGNDYKDLSADADADTAANGDVHFNYGILLRDHLQQYPKAVIQFEAALKIHPTDAEAEEELLYTRKLLQSHEKQDSDALLSGGMVLREDSSADDDAPTPNQLSQHKLTLARKKERDKRGSSFRKSQHDAFLPQMKLLADDMDEDYQKLLDDKKKIAERLEEKSSELNTLHIFVNEQRRVLHRMTPERTNELRMYSQKGPTTVAQNAEHCWQLLKLCRSIFDDLPTMEKVLAFEAAERQDRSDSAF